MNDFPAYTLVDTETRRITSHFVQQAFQISVAQPLLHPGDRATSCHVLYLFDANFYFGGVTKVTRLIRAISEPWLHPQTRHWLGVVACSGGNLSVKQFEVVEGLSVVMWG